MPQCKFLGIDSGAALSKEFYEKRLGGTYVEGLVGAKNGTFSANVLENGTYILKELQHFSFTHFLSNYFKGNLIDLLFMDIEGDEFELMKDMIDNPELYPPICQLNVEFHEFSKKFEIMLPLFNKLFGESSYVPIKGGFFFNQINKFHLINLKNDECLQKYFIK
uniref:Methyltransferase FkbM domain-containing protein n=1 Tax=Panagrolaimus sp. PS1159 TaxID=55785 RepID=A0AC35GXC5_9BILA